MASKKETAKKTVKRSEPDWEFLHLTGGSFLRFNHPQRCIIALEHITSIELWPDTLHHAVIISTANRSIHMSCCLPRETAAMYAALTSAYLRHFMSIDEEKRYLL